MKTNGAGPAGRRVLALDVGLRRTGIALSDPSRRLAAPLETVELSPRALIRRVLALVEEHDVGLIVIGHPELHSGRTSAPSKLIADIESKLRAASGIPVRLWDETLTTWEAESLLREPGRGRRRTAKEPGSGKRARAAQGEIDRVAAALILQDFLDAQSVPDRGAERSDP